MKQIICLFLGLFILVLAGCNNDEELIKEQQNELELLNNKIIALEDTIEEQRQIIDDHNKEFSYLNEFSTNELELYKLFAEEKDIEHLSGFSPDKILLIYLHSVVKDDVEAIYALTYNDGNLPDLSIFTEKYYTEGLHDKELESTLDYRYYNSIKVKEMAENEVAVEISVNLGLYESVTIMGLKKEDGIWKMDILGLLEYLEEKNK